MGRMTADKWLKRAIIIFLVVRFRLVHQRDCTNHPLQAVVCVTDAPIDSDIFDFVAGQAQKASSVLILSERWADVLDVGPRKVVTASSTKWCHDGGLSRTLGDRRNRRYKDYGAYKEKDEHAHACRR